MVRVRKLKNSNINVGISKYHQYLTSFTIAIVTKDHEMQPRRMYQSCPEEIWWLYYSHGAMKKRCSHIK